jgi:hypothetical protein
MAASSYSGPFASSASADAPDRRYDLLMTSFLRFFVTIVVAAVVSAALGGLFACLIALVSPEFLEGLFSRRLEDPVRYAVAWGLIAGLFLGAVVMCFCLFLTTVIHVANVFKRKNEESKSGL